MLQQAASAALATVAEDYEPAKSSIARAGGIEALLELLLSPDNTVKVRTDAHTVHVRVCPRAGPGSISARTYSDEPPQEPSPCCGVPRRAVSLPRMIVPVHTHTWTTDYSVTINGGACVDGLTLLAKMSTHRETRVARAAQQVHAAAPRPLVFISLPH